MFFKFKVNLIKLSRAADTCMHDGQSENCWYPSPPNSHWKQWKNIYLKLDLPDWCNFCRYIVLLAIKHYLLPSSSAKTSFNNTLLISETTIHLTAKISLALCRPIYLKALLGFFTWGQTLQVIGKTFPGRISQQTQ